MMDESLPPPAYSSISIDLDQEEAENNNLNPPDPQIESESTAEKPIETNSLEISPVKSTFVVKETNDDEEEKFPETTNSEIKITATDVFIPEPPRSPLINFDFSHAGLISELLNALWEEKYVEKHKHDFFIQETVHILKADLEEIHERLFEMLSSDLKIAGKGFASGNIHLALGDEKSANEGYKDAAKCCVEKLSSLRRIDQTIQALKINLVSEYMQTLIVCKSLGSDDEISIIKKLRHFCSTASDFVYQLHINPKIIRALEDQLNPPLLGKKNERERILTDLYKLDYWIASITSRINNSDLHSVKQNLITKTNTKEFNLLDLSSLLKLPISGHKESVYRILLVNNKIISASYDHTIRVWDVSTGVCLFICKGHCGNIFSICTSGERIISGSSDSTVRHLNHVNAVCTKGEKIISISDDREIRIWDLHSGACLNRLQGHTGYVISLCITNDKIITGSYDNSIRIWDLKSGFCLCTLNGHTDMVNCLCIAGERIISCSYDRTIRIWDLNTGICLQKLEGHTSYINRIRVLEGNNMIVSVAYDNLICVWDIATGNCVRKLQGHTGAVISVCVSKDKIITGSMDKCIRVWDIKSGDCLKVLEGHSACINTICIAENYQKIISGSFDKTIRVWDI